MYDRIYPGAKWLDTEGKPIQAHGFSVFWNEKEKLWYWYGENKEKTDGNGTIWHWGVRLYTSKDLCNWTDRGLIIPPQPDDLSSPLHPTYCMDRPHILYCAEGGGTASREGAAPQGEYRGFALCLAADRVAGRKACDPLAQIVEARRTEITKTACQATPDRRFPHSPHKRKADLLIFDLYDTIEAAKKLQRGIFYEQSSRDQSR